MQITLLSSEKDLAAIGQDVVRLFYPDVRILVDSAANADVTIRLSTLVEGRKLTGQAWVETQTGQLFEEAFTDRVPVLGDERNLQKWLVKLALFRLLARYTGTSPGPWGILTGIRPTKIVHRLLDKQWAEPEIWNYLVTNYDMQPEKAGLLTEIALRQRPFLVSPEQAGSLVSAYIGIPFCPTRCAYCSFPAYPVIKYGQLIRPFLQALVREITTLGQVLLEQGIGIQTVYLGGGTPTVLESEQLETLLGTIRSHLISTDTLEITLEAGRPDTITKEKLEIARAYGVTRLSINPQSMNPCTLDKIGRQHSPEDITGSVGMARELGFANINMDIIAGLPGERVSDMDNTLAEIAGLRPENLTVHTLALKRASRIKETMDEFELPDREEVGKMLEVTAEAAGLMDMHPYYLYRQKNMVGPLENIGYARPGFECIYNVQIIEERQSIIGFGGGAGTKFVEPGTWYLTSHYNPKDPETYIKRIEDLTVHKIMKLRGLKNESR